MAAGLFTQLITAPAVLLRPFCPEPPAMVETGLKLFLMTSNGALPQMVVMLSLPFNGSGTFTVPFELWNIGVGNSG